jgi:hypothetical protein
MKKNSSLRLKLNRETLRVLVSPELEGARGGFYTITLQTIVTCDRISCGGTCGAASCGAACNSAVCPTKVC